MSPDDVANLAVCCGNCKQMADLIHNPETGIPSAWWCEPCKWAENVEGKARTITRAEWVRHLEYDEGTRLIKHGQGAALRYGSREIQQ